MIEVQGNEQLPNSRYSDKETTCIDTKITELGLHVKITSNVSKYQYNVYEGIMHKKQLTDGSRIAEDFDSLEEV